MDDDLMLDPIELNFINDFLDHSRALLAGEQDTENSVRSGPMHKEGKLVLRVSNIEGVMPGLFGFCQSFECSITVQSSTQTLKLSINSLYQDELIFDVFEYYGALKIDITVYSRGMFANSKVGDLSLALHDIVLSQEKLEASRINMNSCVNQVDGSQRGCREEYWGCIEVVTLHPGGRGIGSQQPPPIRVKLFARYVPVQHCTICKLRRGRVLRSELHHAALHASPKVMVELIELLGRKGILRPALYLREEISETDRRHRYNALDLALASRNVGVAKVLLQRAGHLCFHRPISRPPRPPSTNHHHTQQQHQLPLFSRHFTPHESCVDKSYFTNSERCNTLVASSDARMAQSDVSSYGGPVHAAVYGGLSCLALLLRFLKKYQNIVNGWDGVSNFTDMINWRGNRTDDFSPLMLACQLGDAACARMLLMLVEFPTMKPIVNVNFVSCVDGSTALMLSCASGSVDIVNMLLSRKKCAVEELPVAADGTSCRLLPSSRSVAETYFGTKSPVSLLECLPLARDRRGRQCVAIAAMHGHASVVRSLVASGIPYSSTDVDGRTALHLAAAYGHLAVCQEIVQAEAHQWEQFPPLPREAGAVHSDSSARGICDDNEQSKLKACVRLADKKRFVGTGGMGVYSKRNDKHESTIRSLVHMTRRPDVLVTLDIRGNRPADLAAINGHEDIVTLLQTAVREVYGFTVHPPIVAPPAIKHTAQSTECVTSASCSSPTVVVSIGKQRDMLTEGSGSKSDSTKDIDGWDDFADNAAYAFATTLRFPTPPASPKTLTGLNDEKTDSDSDHKF